MCDKDVTSSARFNLAFHNDTLSLSPQQKVVNCSNTCLPLITTVTNLFTYFSGEETRLQTKELKTLHQYTY